MNNLLTPRNRLILTAVGVFLVVVVLAVTLVVPQFGKISELGVTVDDAKAQEAAAQALLDRRQVAKKSAVLTDASLLELVAAVPEHPDLPALIIELQDLAYSRDVTLRAIEPLEQVAIVVPEGSYFAVPMKVTIWGTWADTVDFTQALDDVTRQIRVTNVSAVPVDVGDVDDAGLDLPPYAVGTEITLETYVIPPATKTKSNDATAPAAPAQ